MIPLFYILTQIKSHKVFGHYGVISSMMLKNVCTKIVHAVPLYANLLQMLDLHVHPYRTGRCASSVKYNAETKTDLSKSERLVRWSLVGNSKWVYKLALL